MEHGSLWWSFVRMRYRGGLGLLFALCFAGMPAHAGNQTLIYEHQSLTVEGERRIVSVPRGYRLEWLAGMASPRMLTFAPMRVDDLVAGFQLPDGKRWARPAGVAFGPDGALYFSSDSDAEGLFRLMRVGDNSK